MSNFKILLPILLYLVLMMVIAFWGSRRSKQGKGGFIEEYFIGGRSLGGFVLAMTLIATYFSASSFIGGPGLASTKGLGWVLLSMIQVPTAFLTLGVLGKKFAIIARRIKAVTVTDYLYARYRSKAVVVAASVSLIVFFIATMVAQFIGGAVLLQTVTGYPYLAGLLIFGVAVVVYTTFGGFRAVVLTDAIQAVVMVIATVCILTVTIRTGGGLNAIMDQLAATAPAMLEPTAGGAIPQPMILSYWVLVGIGLLGLPQTSVRAMGFKDTKSLHTAMVIGTVVSGFLMLGMHLTGTLSAAVLPEIPANSDSVIPTLVMQILPSFWAGVFLAGPLAAIMSTVSSLLLLASAAVIKDLLMRFRKDALPETAVKKGSIWATGLIGFVTFLLAIRPPDLIVWINLFAFGGLQAAFFWPTVLGLFWKKANACGAFCSMAAGVAFFIWMTVSGYTVGSINNIVPTLLVSFVAFLLGSFGGKKPTPETTELFFG